MDIRKRTIEQALEIQNPKKSESAKPSTQESKFRSPFPQDAIDRGWLREGRTTDQGPDYLAVLATALEIAAGLAHLHSHDVVHGDLSVRIPPEVVVVGCSGQWGPDGVGGNRSCCFCMSQKCGLPQPLRAV